MHQIFSPAVLLSGEVSCPHCAWQGKGNDTEQEDLFLSDAIELYCPSCKAYIGFIDQDTEAG